MFIGAKLLGEKSMGIFSPSTAIWMRACRALETEFISGEKSDRKTLPVCGYAMYMAKP